MHIKSNKAINFEIQTWETYKNVYGKYKFTNYIQYKAQVSAQAESALQV